VPVPPESLRKVVEEVEGGVRIRIYAKPESPREGLFLEEDELVFYTSEPPIEGRANAALIRFLSKALGVSTSRVRIVAGARSRQKIVEVRDARLEEVLERLAQAVEPRV